MPVGGDQALVEQALRCQSNPKFCYPGQEPGDLLKPGQYVDPGGGVGDEGDDLDILETISGAAIGAAVGGALGGVGGGGGEALGGSVGGSLVSDALNKLLGGIDGGAFRDLILNITGGGAPGIGGAGPSYGLSGANIQSILSQVKGLGAINAGGFGGGIFSPGVRSGESGALIGALLKAGKINVGDLLLKGKGSSSVIASLLTAGKGIYGLVG